MSRQCDDAGPFSSLNAGKMKGSASGMLAEPSRNRRSDEAQPQVREGGKGGSLLAATAHAPPDSALFRCLAKEQHDLTGVHVRTDRGAADDGVARESFRSSESPATHNGV